MVPTPGRTGKLKEAPKKKPGVKKGSDVKGKRRNKTKEFWYEACVQYNQTGPWTSLGLFINSDKSHDNLQL